MGRTNSAREVLMIEDSDTDRLLVERMFRREHIRNPIVAAATTQRAFEFLFDDAAEPPLLVILDLNLGHGDVWEGLDVLRAMRRHERTVSIPCLILTVMEEQEAQINSLNLQPLLYQRKPLDMNQLTEAVKRLNLQWELLPGEE